MTLTTDAVASAGSIDDLDFGFRLPRRRLPSGWSILLASTVTLGLILRLLPTLRGASLTGVREYDDGVHYAAGLALAHGRLPYRDFVLLHPPGIAILMAPFAVLGGLVGEPTAMGVARIFVLIVAAANMMLIAWFARPYGRAAAAAGVALYAVWPGAVVADRTVMLEPLLNLFCLLALLALRRRRPFAAGLLIAAAACLKLFAVTMLIALALTVVRDRAVRRRFAAGVAAGVAAIAGPFFLLAPAAMWHDVVVVQATRPASGVAGPAARVVAGLPALWPGPTGAVPFLVLVVAGVVLAARQRESWPWLAMLASTTLAFVVGASFFVHYSGYLVLAVVLTLVTAMPTSGVPARAVAVATVALCCVVAAQTLTATTVRQPAVTTTSSLPPGCVWSESPSLLVSIDRLSPPSSGCREPIDPRGSVLAAAGPVRRPFYPDGFRGVAAAQRSIRGELSHARLLVLRGPLSQDPLLDAANQAVVDAQFHPLLTQNGITVWERN